MTTTSALICCTTIKSRKRRGWTTRVVLCCLSLTTTVCLVDGFVIKNRGGTLLPSSSLFSTVKEGGRQIVQLPQIRQRCDFKITTQLASKAQQQEQDKEQGEEQEQQSAPSTSTTTNVNEVYFDDDQIDETTSSPIWTEGLKQEAYFDIDECVLGDSCDLVSSKQTLTNIYHNSQEYSSANMADATATAATTSTQPTPLEERLTTIINQSLTLIPIVSPILAFMSYEIVGKMFEMTIETMAQKNWVAVDGGALQTKILTPAINGIVVPSISILFATLISNTVATLRQRQLDVRTTLNTEAGDLRVLVSMVDSFPMPFFSEYQDRCRSYLLQYTTRVIAESQSGVKINSLEFTGSLDSEINGFLNQLNEMNSIGLNTNGDDDGDDKKVAFPGHILSESYGALTRLNSLRSTRISALQSTFPPLHYGILFMLAASICVTFLIESNQELLYFLNAVQLKILWTMLIGTFSALSVVCYDLSDPFRGSYEISTCVDQLYTIRDTLRAASQMKESASKSSQED